MSEIIRDFNDYSLAFPCNPHDLRPCAIGFRLLFWSDFLLVVSLLFMMAVMCWFTLNSPEFQTFCEEMTPEKIVEIQKLPLVEQQKYFAKALPLEQIMPSVTLISFSFLAGILINLAGTIFCMNCPPISGAKSYGLVWLGVGLVNGIPGLNAFVPLLYLIAWNYWISFLFRLAFLLGETKIPPLLHRIHQTVFFTLISFLLASLVSPALFVLVIGFFLVGFFQYAKVLKLLRLKIHEQTQFWDYGCEDFHSKKLA